MKNSKFTIKVRSRPFTNLKIKAKNERKSNIHKGKDKER